MLGSAIHDPEGLEGEPGSCHGLGLLDMETTLRPEKQLIRRQGKLRIDDGYDLNASDGPDGPDGPKVEGYEIHMGVSSGPAMENPMVIFSDGSDGAMSGDRQILGTYLHGLFDHTEAALALLKWAGLNENNKSETPFDYNLLKESELDRLAETFAEHLDIDFIEGLIS